LLSARKLPAQIGAILFLESPDKAVNEKIFVVLLANHGKYFHSGRGA
jgi:hypothetical protein